MDRVALIMYRPANCGVCPLTKPSTVPLRCTCCLIEQDVLISGTDANCPLPNMDLEAELDSVLDSAEALHRTIDSFDIPAANRNGDHFDVAAQAAELVNEISKLKETIFDD